MIEFNAPVHLNFRKLLPTSRQGMCIESSELNPLESLEDLRARYFGQPSWGSYYLASVVVQTEKLDRDRSECWTNNKWRNSTTLLFSISDFRDSDAPFQVFVSRDYDTTPSRIEKVVRCLEAGECGELDRRRFLASLGFKELMPPRPGNFVL